MAVKKKTFRWGRGNLNIKTNLMSMFVNSNHCHKCMMMSRTTACFRILHFTKKGPGLYLFVKIEVLSFKLKLMVVGCIS